MLGALGVLAACDKPDKPANESRRLTVYAASSLTDAFKEIESTFEKSHPDVDVAVNFAGSQVLRIQLEQGAAADVFASANQKHMAALVEENIVSSSEIFAHNELVLIVPQQNPAGLDAFEDLPEASRLVVGTDNVPVGIYTRRMFKKARKEFGDGFVDGVRDSIVSHESNVRLVRAKVAMGDADAAIVYRTDAVSSDRVEILEIPRSINVRASYPIGPVASNDRPELAGAFIDFVRSSEGRDILEDHGFRTETE